MFDFQILIWLPRRKENEKNVLSRLLSFGLPQCWFFSLADAHRPIPKLRQKAIQQTRTQPWGGTVRAFWQGGVLSNFQLKFKKNQLKADLLEWWYLGRSWYSGCRSGFIPKTQPKKKRKKAEEQLEQGPSALPLWIFLQWNESPEDFEDASSLSLDLLAAPAL